MVGSGNAGVIGMTATVEPASPAGVPPLRIGAAPIQSGGQDPLLGGADQGSPMRPSSAGCSVGARGSSTISTMRVRADLGQPLLGGLGSYLESGSQGAHLGGVGDSSPRSHRPTCTVDTPTASAIRDWDEPSSSLRRRAERPNSEPRVIFPFPIEPAIRILSNSAVRYLELSNHHFVWPWGFSTTHRHHPSSLRTRRRPSAWWAPRSSKPVAGLKGPGRVRFPSASARHSHVSRCPAPEGLPAPPSGGFDSRPPPPDIAFSAPSPRGYQYPHLAGSIPVRLRQISHSACPHRGATSTPTWRVRFPSASARYRIQRTLTEGLPVPPPGGFDSRPPPPDIAFSAPSPRGYQYPHLAGSIPVRLRQISHSAHPHRGATSTPTCLGEPGQNRC